MIILQARCGCGTIVTKSVKREAFESGDAPKDFTCEECRKAKEEIEELFRQ